MLDYLLTSPDVSRNLTPCSSLFNPFRVEWKRGEGVVASTQGCGPGLLKFDPSGISRFIFVNALPGQMHGIWRDQCCASICPSALYPMPSALCPMLHALCPMLSAACPMPHALCPPATNPAIWRDLRCATICFPPFCLSALLPFCPSAYCFTNFCINTSDCPRISFAK